MRSNRSSKSSSKSSSNRSSRNGTTNATEMRLIGMSRSGAHAIIHWILSQWEGRTCFLNCAEAGRNPFETCRPLDDGVCYRTSYPDFDIQAERAGRFSHKDLLIHNYEDTFLRPLARAQPETVHDAWVGASGERIDLLVLRDPFNLFASRIRKGAGSVSSRVAMRIWKQHARQFLGWRRALRQNRLVAISYNRWATDEGYRRGIAAQLGMHFTDAGFETVPAVAQGSSFDGLSFDGAASRMPVNQRWRRLAHDPSYVELFDPEAVRLASAAFGEVCRVRVTLMPGGEERAQEKSEHPLLNRWRAAR